MANFPFFICFLVLVESFTPSPLPELEFIFYQYPLCGQSISYSSNYLNCTIKSGKDRISYLELNPWNINAAECCAYWFWLGCVHGVYVKECRAAKKRSNPPSRMLHQECGQNFVGQKYLVARVQVNEWRLDF